MKVLILFIGFYTILKSNLLVKNLNFSEVFFEIRNGKKLFINIREIRVRNKLIIEIN